MADRKSYNPWYLIEDSDEAADQMDCTIKDIESAQSGRLRDLLRFSSMYLNRDCLSMSVSGGDPYLPAMPRAILNCSQAIVDTVVSKHVEAETKVSFEVEDGDFAAHQNAEDMERFCWGEFQRLDLYLKAEMSIRDCCVSGDGWLKWYPKNGKAFVERTLPFEVLIDDAAAASCAPQEMYQRRYVPRGWAMMMFKDKAAQIAELPTTEPDYAFPGADTDVVRLIEGWHLASDEGEEDGRHIIACGNVILLDEPWSYTDFPFARIPWSPALMGAYSTGLMEQLQPLQLELNKMMKRIQHSLHLMSVPRIWQSSSSKVSPEYDNLIGNVYKYSGPKPEIDAAPAVNPELYAQADRIRERMYEQARQNPMQSGDMPSRFDSRPALREAQEIADQPHAWVGLNWQRLFVSCGKQLVRVAREIVKEHGTYKTFGRARGFVETIDWADCDLEDSRFVMTPQPTSLLPTTPTGKRLVVQDLMQNGLLSDPNEAWEMLAGMPDVDAVTSEKTAQKRLVDKQLYLMIKKNRPMVPDEVQDPVYSKRRAQAQLQMLLTKENVPEEVLALLDDYIAQCDILYQQANPPPPPPDPAQMMQPGLLPPGAPNGALNGNPGQPVQPGPPGIGITGQPGGLPPANLGG